MTEVKIQIVDYNLFKYEKNFLAKEIRKAGGKIKEKEIERNSLLVIPGLPFEKAKKLTFVKGVFLNDVFFPSIQSIRESFNGKTTRTQSRRYGPHGLHEYKGRFNPQTPRSLILANFNKGSVVMDPFMGSGTTLIEARDLGYKAFGVELNPFAFLLAKAKKIYGEMPSFGKIIWKPNLMNRPFYDKETKNINGLYFLKTGMKFSKNNLQKRMYDIGVFFKDINKRFITLLISLHEYMIKVVNRLVEM